MSADPDVISIRELCSEEPILRDSRTLAADIDKVTTLRGLREAINTQAHAGWFTTSCEPHLTFITWGRFWNFITCRALPGGGWQVSGAYVPAPKAGA